MDNREKIRKMMFAAVLIAISIIIPTQFGFLKIIIGPFTATIASHVPMFLAMLISPEVAIAVGVGSALGFFITSPLVIAARAAMHIVVGYVGALIIKKDKNLKKSNCNYSTYTWNIRRSSSYSIWIFSLSICGCCCSRDYDTSLCRWSNFICTSKCFSKSEKKKPL